MKLGFLSTFKTSTSKVIIKYQCFYSLNNYNLMAKSQALVLVRWQLARVYCNTNRKHEFSFHYQPLAALPTHIVNCFHQLAGKL